MFVYCTIFQQQVEEEKVYKFDFIEIGLIEVMRKIAANLIGEIFFWGFFQSMFSHLQNIKEMVLMDWDADWILKVLSYKLSWIV